jgi:hypothetical protein
VVEALPRAELSAIQPVFERDVEHEEIVLLRCDFPMVAAASMAV